MPATKMTAATYLRSSKDRAEIGVDSQRAELADFAEKAGLSLVAEFSDMELSGSGDETTRPGLAALLEAVRDRNRGWDVLLALDTSRLARDPMIAGYIHVACEKAGVTIQYAKVAVDATTAAGEMMINVMRAFDRLHARMSGEKGKAGQAENIKQGFRSGGRAPLGYRLEKIATGGVRGGQPVMKSRLLPDPLLAPKVAQFLTLRAEGVSRAEAIRRSGLAGRNPATMIGVEGNALVYAGHLVWNRRQKHRPSRECPKQQMIERDASEWVVSEEKTHEALISREQAEAVLALTAIKQKQARKVRREDFILSGLLYAPDGVSYWADAKMDAYRAGPKGKRISRWLIEEEVVGQIHRDSQSREFRAKLLASIKQYAKTIKVADKDIDTDLAKLNKQLTNLIELTASGSKAAARKIAQIEEDIAQLEQLRAGQAVNANIRRQLLGMNEQDVAQWLLSLDVMAWRGGKPDSYDTPDPLHDVAQFVEKAEATNTEAHLRMRRWITSLLDRIEYDPETRVVQLHYKWSGVKLASPGGQSDNSNIVLLKQQFLLRRTGTAEVRARAAKLAA